MGNTIANDCVATSSVSSPLSVKPNAKGRHPEKSRIPVAVMNSSFFTRLEIKYTSIGGDQIEVSPPKIPETDPARSWATPSQRCGMLGLGIV